MMHHLWAPLGGGYWWRRKTYAGSKKPLPTIIKDKVIYLLRIAEGKASHPPDSCEHIMEGGHVAQGDSHCPSGATTHDVFVVPTHVPPLKVLSHLVSCSCTKARKQWVTRTMSLSSQHTCPPSKFSRISSPAHARKQRNNESCTWCPRHPRTRAPLKSLALTSFEQTLPNSCHGKVLNDIGCLNTSQHTLVLSTRYFSAHIKKQGWSELYIYAVYARIFKKPLQKRQCTHRIYMGPTL